jgi:hypothetical protein
MAEVASGLFTLAGTALGWVLKSAESIGASERRANGKVLAGINKIKFELQFLNDMLLHEVKSEANTQIGTYITSARAAGIGIEEADFADCLSAAYGARAVNLKQHYERAAKAARDSDTKLLKTEGWPKLPTTKLRKDTRYGKRVDGLWQIIVPKIEETVADNTLQLSKGFTDAFWEFYYDLLKPGASDWHDYVRYIDAEAVYNAHFARLEAAARGNRFARALPFIGLFIAGVLTTIFVLVALPSVYHSLADFPEFVSNRLTNLRPAGAQ